MVCLLHARSEVAVGPTTSNSSEAQVVCAVQDSAFCAVEYVPAEQGTQLPSVSSRTNDCTAMAPFVSCDAHDVPNVWQTPRPGAEPPSGNASHSKPAHSAFVCAVQSSLQCAREAQSPSFVKYMAGSGQKCLGRCWKSDCCRRVPAWHTGVGAGVGCAVGAGVGLCVGLGVGAGDAVGGTVGLGVGATVGALVGEGVGEEVAELTQRV